MFSLNAALAARNSGTFVCWLDTYLRGEGRNIPLADGLNKEQRWWFGPEEIELSRLVLKCGPGLEYHEDQEVWDNRIRELARLIIDGLEVPPLIAEYKEGVLYLADGNHRCGALTLNGVERYWTAIWFNSHAEYDSFCRTS